jgi:fumarate reductase subunit D
VRLLHWLEPLLWLLFGAGGFAAALLLPALMFGVTVAAPVGWFSDYAISYHRVHSLAANPAGRVILAAVISLVLWHAAHHLRHLLLDLGLARFHAPLAYLLYGLALLGTLASVQAVASL